MPDYDVSIDKTSLDTATESIKRVRAKMMRNCGPMAYVWIHRHVDMEHSDGENCLCDPVTIAQRDLRPSIEFAREILYPVFH